MYIPNHFKTENKDEIIDFVKKYSFATIVTVKNNIPSATHIPFAVQEENNEIILYAHFAKGNPQVNELLENNVLVIFAEPHAYISPKNYEGEQNVPTWNYMAVHLYGTAELILDQNKKIEMMELTISTFESEYLTQWSQLSNDYKQKMLNGIVAFKIKVNDIQAKKKLSQNRSAYERTNIINTLKNSELTSENAISELMHKNEEFLKE
ncbi:MAG: FMN-binding negative transcriptional regulator [Bacteroidota bacterium]|nr:FMN-binding negative transcriptional regulator [Bacteroidota bacterium]